MSAALTELERRLVRHVEERDERLFDLLAALVRFRTPNPPGGNEGGARDWIEACLRELQLEVDRWDALPGRPNVVGTWRGSGGGPSVALNGHIDVCEDRRLEEWSSDPYEPRRDGRDMIGRRTTDLRSATASFLFAIQALRAHDVSLVGDVVFQSVIGEEAGEPGTRGAIERGHRADFAIVGESSRGRDLIAWIGVINCRITVESPSTLYLVARKFTTNAGGELSGANCVEKMALGAIPALTDLERQWAVFKTHPLMPLGACNINVVQIEGGAKRSSSPTAVTPT